MLVNTSKNPLTTTATLLASIGAINWGLISLFNFNLVAFLFGDFSTLARIVYILVGVSGLYILTILVKVLMTPSIENIQ